MSARTTRSAALGVAALLSLVASFHDDGGGGRPTSEPSVYFLQPGTSHVIVHQASFEVAGGFGGSVDIIDLRIDGGDPVRATRADDDGWRVAASRISVSPGLHELTATATNEFGTSDDELWLYYEPDPSVKFRVALVPDRLSYAVPFTGIEDSPELLLLGPAEDNIRLDISVESPPQISTRTNEVLDTGSYATLGIDIVDEVPGVYPIVVTARSAAGEVHDATHTITLTGPPATTTTSSTSPPQTTEGAPVGAPIAVLSDDFDGADHWTAATTRSGNGTTATAELAGGGNPGGFRRMTHVLPGTSDGEDNPTQITVLHTFGGGGWDPSTDGPIDRIDVREDQIMFDPPFDGAAIGARIAVVQDGTTYLASINPDNAFRNTDWQTVAVAGLTPADFTPAPGPDFSATGEPLSFGFLRSNTNRSATGIVTQHGIDNWSVTLHLE